MPGFVYSSCGFALPASLQSVWVWWFIGGCGGEVAPSRAGVVGQLRGSCLLVFGMLRFEMLVRFEHPIIPFLGMV